MWGTSSPTDKLTGDLGNVIEAAQIGVRRSDRITATKSSPGNFGLLQHNRHETDVLCVPTNVCSGWKSGHAADITAKTGLDLSATSVRNFCCDAQRRCC